MNDRIQLPGLRLYPDLLELARQELAKAGCCGSRLAIIRKYIKKSQERLVHNDAVSRVVPNTLRRLHKLI